MLAGIDTLYLSSAAGLRRELVRELLELKEQARNCNRDGLPLPRWRTIVAVNGEQVPLDLEVSHKGAKGGKGDLVLQSETLALVLHSKAPRNLPCAYVELHALLLWSGWDRATRIAEALLVAVADPLDRVEVQVSRIDLAVDFIGWAPDETLLEHIVSRVVRRDRLYDVAPSATDPSLLKLHGRGRSFTGFSFGGGPLLCRLYDKTVEMKVSNKTWFLEKWKSGGYIDEETSGHVWRLEFQVRREVLRQCTLTTRAMVDGTDPVVDEHGVGRGLTEVKRWADLREGLNDLWRYLTEEWLCYRLPRTATQRNVLHPRWVTLSQARFIDLPDGTLSRHRRLWTMNRYLGAIGGYLAREHSLDCIERDVVPDPSRFEADLLGILRQAMKHHENRRGVALYDASRALYHQQLSNLRLTGAVRLARAKPEQLSAHLK